jgi:hypothetical protein
MQIMVSSQQQLGWLGQPGGGGSDFQERPTTYNTILSSQKIQFTFSNLFLLIEIDYIVNQ